MKKPSREVLQINNFDLKTTWAHKIGHGGAMVALFMAYEFGEDHNRNYLYAALGILPFFLLSIKKIRKQFRDILGDDRAKSNIEIDHNYRRDQD